MKAIKNWIVNLIWLVLFVLFASGCSTVELASGYIVSEYCDTPHTTRLAVRAFVNAGAAPHTVRIDCEGDTDFFTPSN